MLSSRTWTLVMVRGSNVNELRTRADAVIAELNSR